MKDQNGKAERLISEQIPIDPIPADLFVNSMVAISVIREDGLIVFINAAAAKMYAVVGGPGLGAGVNVMSLTPPGFMAARVEFMRELAAHGKDGISRDILAGEQVISYLHLLPTSEDAGLRQFFIIHQRSQAVVTEATFPEVMYNDSKEQDLGGLTVLSPRELEVLSLVGQGMTAAEIAERIHRSLETVNTHKASILRKLDCHNAVQLSRIANKAGLKFTDGGHLAGS